MLNYLCLLFVALSFGALEGPKNLIQPYPQTTLMNEIVQFQPVAGHKFNLSSPNSCGKGRLVSAEEDQILCQVSSTGAQNLELFVCDKKKTYCKREMKTIQAQSPEGLLAWTKHYWAKLMNSDSWSEPKKFEKSPNAAARGFMQNDVYGAIQRAKSENKKILLFMTQIYCPPCRMMKELALESDDFAEITKDFVLLQVDTDMDVSPEKIAPLKYRYTPTMYVLNADFQEIDRRVGAIAPGDFKNWFDSLEAISWQTVAELQSKKEQSPEEVLHLSRNAYSAMDSELAYDLVKDQSGVWVDVLKLANELEKDPENQNLSFANNLSTKSIQCGSLTNKAFMMELFGVIEGSSSASEKKTILSKANELEKSLLAQQRDRPVSCAFALNTLYSVMGYLLNKTEKKSLQAQVTKKHIALLKSFPKLPGVKKTSQIEVELADLTKNDEKKEQLYTKMKSENKEDYTYDFWEALDAFRSGDPERALVKVNESLKVAKSRSWQKAFKFKLDVLKKLEREEQALGLIEEALKEIELPYSEHPKIHQFVQELRAKQRELSSTTKPQEA